MQSIFNHRWREQALAGQADAVKLLAHSALEPLYAFCFYRVGKNRTLCEEVVQETLLIALRTLARYEPKRAADNIFPWLTGLARNEIQRVLAREKGAHSLVTVWANLDRELQGLYARLEAEPFGDDVLRREETRDLVNVTMSQLPSQYRETLEAKYVANKSVRDIAVMLSLSEKAVESQLTRARKAFRATFLTLSRNLEPV